MCIGLDPSLTFFYSPINGGVGGGGGHGPLVPYASDHTTFGDATPTTINITTQPPPLTIAIVSPLRAKRSQRSTTIDKIRPYHKFVVIILRLHVLYRV